MSNSANSFGFLLQDTARLMRRNFNRDIQDLKITQAQWQILFNLSRNQGIRQAQLAEMLEMQPISVARLVDRMEAAGWIKRTPDPADRRAVNLYLEKKAEALIEKLRERGTRTRTQAMNGISGNDQKIFMNVLQKMRDNLAAE